MAEKKLPCPICGGTDTFRQGDRGCCHRCATGWALKVCGWCGEEEGHLIPECPGNKS